MVKRTSLGENIEMVVQMDRQVRPGMVVLIYDQETKRNLSTVKEIHDLYNVWYPLVEDMIRDMKVDRVILSPINLRRSKFFHLKLFFQPKDYLALVEDKLLETGVTAEDIASLEEDLAYEVYQYWGHKEDHQIVSISDLSSVLEPFILAMDQENIGEFGCGIRHD